jgi:IS5 family transposase
MLLVAYLFNLSEREAEETVRFNLPAKYFVGLGVDEAPPDHSTLTVFKDRILKEKGPGYFEALFQTTIRLAKQKGIAFGSLQVIDSTHTTAKVNLDQETQRREQGKPPRDPDASLKTKGHKTVTTQAGQRLTVKDQIYGFKAHTSYNDHNQLITNLTVTTAKRDDGQEFISLIKKDLRIGAARRQHIGKRRSALGTIYAADKGYDGGDNHTYLESHGLHSAIILKTTRTTHQDKTLNDSWLKLQQSNSYRFGTYRRRRIEKKFGEEKLHHGLDRCRYLGLKRYAIQAYLTAMTVNLKRILTLSLPPPLAVGVVG